MNVKTVTDAFVKWMVNENIGTFGTNLFIRNVPDTAPDNCWWVVTSGGSPIQKLATGEQVKQYFVTVHYRSTSSEDAENKLFDFEELVNCAQCVELEKFEVQEIEASQYPVDTDTDNNERYTGFVQANIKIYKKEC